MDEVSSTRLNKYLALHAGVSRREADDMIAAGRVTINDETAIIGNQVRVGDKVKLDAAELVQQQKTTLILNKPRGYVCSRKQQGDTPTIYSLLPDNYHALKSAGRLDADSSGLLIMTNDGDLSHQLTHPSNYKQKVYLLSLDKDLAPLHQQIIADYGVDLEDGKSQLGLMRLYEGDAKEWQVTMSEGRNRQIRRTFASLGYTVTNLHRTNFGDYSLGDIKSGEYKLSNTR